MPSAMSTLACALWRWRFVMVTISSSLRITCCSQLTQRKAPVSKKAWPLAGYMHCRAFSDVMTFALLAVPQPSGGSVRRWVEGYMMAVCTGQISGEYRELPFLFARITRQRCSFAEGKSRCYLSDRPAIKPCHGSEQLIDHSDKLDLAYLALMTAAVARSRRL